MPKAIKGYPTKNFLPHFKGTHLSFLLRHYGEEHLYSFPFMVDIRDKHGINLTDYENIYKCEGLREGVVAMFKSRVLYRELMISRCYHGARTVHHEKLHLFEKAFRSKVFDKIN